jgi:hypothetical protein
MQNAKIVHLMAALDACPHPLNALEAVQAALDIGASHIKIDITTPVNRGEAFRNAKR